MHRNIGFCSLFFLAQKQYKVFNNWYMYTIQVPKETREKKNNTNKYNLILINN